VREEWENVTLSTETIWTSFREPLRRYVERRLAEPADAEDVLQDVFLKIHANLGDLRDEERLVPWLYRIARNAVIDRYRRRDPAEPLPEGLEVPAEIEEPEASRAVAACLGDMIRDLEEPYREALLLSELEGLPQRAVAERLGLSYSGAKSRIQRGRGMLRDALLNCCHFEFDRRGRILEYAPRVSCCRAKPSS
jgi:RNA polymerase sigma-70 factor (ECF subfamily)